MKIPPIVAALAEFEYLNGDIDTHVGDAVYAAMLHVTLAEAVKLQNPLQLKKQLIRQQQDLDDFGVELSKRIQYESECG